MSLTTGVCVQQVRQPALRELTSSAAHQCFQKTSTPSWGVCVQGFPCTAFGRHHQWEQEIPQRRKSTLARVSFCSRVPIPLCTCGLVGKQRTYRGTIADLLFTRSVVEIHFRDLFHGVSSSTTHRSSTRTLVVKRSLAACARA